MVDAFADWLGLEPDPNPPVRSWEATSRLNRARPSAAHPEYRLAPGYPRVQYAQDGYQPQIYNMEAEAVAYGYFDPQYDTYRVPVTLPAFVEPHKFETVMKYDSCASAVYLGHADARRMGLPLGKLTYAIPFKNAGRDLRASQFDLPVMKIGQIKLEEVRVLVPQLDIGMSFLGQSALRKLNSVEQQGDQIIFRR